MEATEATGAAIADLEAAGAVTAPSAAAASAPAAAPAMRVFAIGDWGDVAIARHQARRLAREHGVEPRRAGEVAIVVSELASNIVKYAGRGEIALCVTSMDGGAGAAGGGAFAATRGMVLTVQARDAGPPIHDLAVAMRDGHDDRGPLDPAAMAQRGGLGTGLGAVARLADSFEVRQEAGGKQITATFSRGLPRGV
jgi:anti-sigma regulatory factor (Ser/Thr protein kinase)